MGAKRETVTLIGAGLAGSLLAIFLARRGFRVEVYEKRPDIRREAAGAGQAGQPSPGGQAGQSGQAGQAGQAARPAGRSIWPCRCGAFMRWGR